MGQTAAPLVDHVIPYVPVRWLVLLPPIPLRLLLAAQPNLMTPALRVLHCALTRLLLDQTWLKAGEAGSGTVTPMQRFGSVASLPYCPHSDSLL